MKWSLAATFPNLDEFNKHFVPSTNIQAVHNTILQKQPSFLSTLVSSFLFSLSFNFLLV